MVCGKDKDKDNLSMAQKLTRRAEVQLHSFLTLALHVGE